MKRYKIMGGIASLIALLLVLATLLAGCGNKANDNSGGISGENGDNVGNPSVDGSVDDPGDDPVDDPSDGTDDHPTNDPTDDPTDNPGDDPVKPDNPGISGSIAVTTTATYCYADSYSFTAPITGNYTFTVPAGLGFVSSTALRPEVDFQLTPNGGSFTLGLTKGSVLVFAVGSTVKGSWSISWEAYEGEVTVSEEPDYDIIIEANDTDGHTFNYTATQTGNLTVTVTDLAYDYIGNGGYVVAGDNVFELGFPRMYRLVVNGEVYKTHSVTVPVSAGDTVTIQLYCQYGYATKANIETIVKSGSGNTGTNYPAAGFYDIVLDAQDTNGRSFTYTATSAGELVITVTYLAYDYKGEGEYYVADADTLKYGFSKMYALEINGENVGAYTVSLSVKAGEKISVRLYCHHGYATNAIVSVAYVSADSSGGGNEAAKGTETNPIILTSFPGSVTINSDTSSFTYYRITAQQSGTVTFTWPSADSWFMIIELNSDGSNTSNSASGYLTESFSFEIKEGTQYAVSLGTWNIPGNVTVAVTVN